MAEVNFSDKENLLGRADQKDWPDAVLTGLSEGEEVILHPSNQAYDGMRVRTK